MGKRGNARGCEGPLRVKRGYIGFNGGGSDTLRVTHGEPYAGKRHVRFDEGAGVPDEGRPALLYWRGIYDTAVGEL